MPDKNAQARIKINKLLESSAWRFFDDASGSANIVLESNIKLMRSTGSPSARSIYVALNASIEAHKATIKAI